MPQLLSPHRLTFRGHIEVSALAFPRSLFSQNELQMRVLMLWRSGARLEEFDWGHVLFWPSPQKMRASEAPATPLVQSRNRLVSALLERDEELSEGVWIIENGQWRALQNGKPVDVSLWLFVGEWPVPTTTSLGEVPKAPLVLAPVDLDLRAGSGIGAPDAKWQTIWERGTKGLMSDFAPGFWLQQASRLVTPPREVNGKVIASDGSIVLSAALVLGGALLFFLSSLASPSNAKFSSGALTVLVMMLGVAAF